MKINSLLALITTVASLAVSGVSHGATTLALWTFETSLPAATDSASISGLAAETGTGTASGLHASSATDWSNPSGNGSAESFSANTWATGDYFQFQVSTTGYEDIQLSFDQVRSSTGPSTFQVQYSIDGTTFTDFGSAYTVLSAPSWSASLATTLTSFAFDFSSITTLDDDGSIFFRLTSTVTPAAGGTSRVDNVQISGTAIVAIPEPSRALLLGLGGIGLIFRRRRQ